MNKEEEDDEGAAAAAASSATVPKQDNSKSVIMLASKKLMTSLLLTSSLPQLSIDDKSHKTIKCDNFQTELSQNLFKFRNENLFTDVSIFVEGVEFKCHKVVLCAASAYFTAMFSCDLKESRLGKVYIENLSPWTMKRLIDFIYTGVIEVNCENVIDIFNAACMFQLYALVEKCTDYIREHIDASNCVEINVFATLHQLDKLERETFEFMLENFMLVYECGDKGGGNNDDEATVSYTHLSKETFSSLLASDQLNVSREIYVYQALCKWIEHNKEHVDNAQALFESLFKYIRLNALSADELEHILSRNAYVRANSSLAAQVREKLGPSNFDENQAKATTTTTSNEDTAASSLLSDSSASSSSSSSNLPFRSSINRTIQQLQQQQQQQQPQAAQQEQAATMVPRPSTIPRDYLCVLSAEHFKIYDFYRSKWDMLSNWPPSSASSTSSSSGRRLNGFATCFVNNHLYVIGGALHGQADDDGDGLELVDTVWRFDPATLEWSQCRPTLCKRAFHHCLSLQSTSAGKTSHYIFLLYGLCHDENQNSNNDNEEQGNTTTGGGDAHAGTAHRLALRTGHHLIPCVTLELYSLDTDTWSVLTTNNSLLNHHIFKSINIFSSGGQHRASAAIPSLTTASFAQPTLRNMISHQLTQARSIVSLRNILYILKENCIHCYEFTSQQQIICLPYFRLPEYMRELVLVLGAAMAVKASPNACLSQFSWLAGDPQHHHHQQQQQQAAPAAASQPSSSSSSSSSSSISPSVSDPPTVVSSLLSDADLRQHHQQHQQQQLASNLQSRNFRKEEVLIYLVAPLQGYVFEFFPAKNKLKKLPQLALRHALTDTFVLNFKGKLYVTGGIQGEPLPKPAPSATSSPPTATRLHHYASSSADNSPTSTISAGSNNNTASNSILPAPSSNVIEEYDPEHNAWSIFTGSLPGLGPGGGTSTPPVVLQQQQQQQQAISTTTIPLKKNYFKLKMTLI